VEENRNVEGCPKSMPADLADRYTMNGLIGNYKLKYYFELMLALYIYIYGPHFYL